MGVVKPALAGHSLNSASQRLAILLRRPPAHKRVARHNRWFGDSSSRLLGRSGTHPRPPNSIWNSYPLASAGSFHGRMPKIRR